MDNQDKTNETLAVIMAGGEGRRLYPLTKDIPKPLVKVGGKPVIKYIIERLAEAGVKEAAVTTRYLGEMISDCLGDEYSGVRLRYFTEDIPLGTAGSVKSAESMLRGCREFLIVSGDAYCEFDLKRAIELHRQKGAPLTMILKRIDDPLEYGTVLTDGGGFVCGFVEKPTWSHAFSETVNTGVYVASPDALKYIPEKKFYDFGRDLFPYMCENGIKISAVEDGGHWWDIGDLGKLLECNISVAGKSIIEDGAEIGRNVTVVGSIIYSGAVIGSGSSINKSIICENAVIPKNTQLPEFSIVTSDSVTVFKEKGNTPLGTAKGLAGCADDRLIGVAGAKRRRILEELKRLGFDSYDLGSFGKCAGYGARRLGLDIAYDSDADRLYDKTGLPADRLTQRRFSDGRNIAFENKTPGHIINKEYISESYRRRSGSGADWNAVGDLIVAEGLGEVSLPYYCPDSLVERLREEGIGCEFYSMFPYDGSEKEAREKASKYEWLVFPETAAYHLGKHGVRKETVDKRIVQLSETVGRNEKVSPVRIMQRLGKPGGEGVNVKFKRGGCKVLPDGRSYLLFAEGDSVEAASEILSLTESEIRRLENE